MALETALYLSIFVIVLSVLVHVILGFEIWRKKRKLQQASNQDGHTKIFIIFKCSQCHESPKTSLLDSMSNALFLAFVLSLPGLLSVLPTIALGVSHFYIHVTAIMSFAVGLPLSVYIRQPHLRKTLGRKLKEELFGIICRR